MLKITHNKTTQSVIPRMTRYPCVMRKLRVKPTMTDFLYHHSRLGFPLSEIAINLQTQITTFFRMKLGRENIVPRNRAGKWCTVYRFTHSQVCIKWRDIITMHEIIMCVVRNARPKWVRAGLVHGVPAHVRNFEIAGWNKSANRFIKYAQARRVVFFGMRAH